MVSYVEDIMKIEEKKTSKLLVFHFELIIIFLAYLFFHLSHFITLFNLQFILKNMFLALSQYPKL